MNNRHDKILFWGCFIALITTSYAFISRIVLCGTQFKADFGLEGVQVGELIGAGIWPFGVSIIVFSLFIDRIGYKVAMIFSFICYIVYSTMALMAYSAIHGAAIGDLVTARHKGLQLLYWGSIILALGNGTVEAYINPMVATLFNRDKTKWLNILHAGWPGGLVIGGLCTIKLSNNTDWRLTLGLILVPAITFFLILVGLTFPKSEREQAGVGYIEMLKELGMFGALVAFGLVFAQLGQVFEWSSTVTWILTGIVVLAFGFLTKSIGRPFLIFLIIIMMPLATTEIGTDGWITALMEKPMKSAGYHAAWVLVYTSAIMMVLRFCAGPIVHKLSPLGLLATCATLAVLGLTALSNTAGAGIAAIFGAATLYGIGKTFFWPTMLGLTSEQCPKGGALTLNSMGGIGMLAVGILGTPFIGYLQESKATQELQSKNQVLYQSVAVTKSWVLSPVLGDYQAIDPVNREKAPLAQTSEAKATMDEAESTSRYWALGRMAMFPGFMLCCYIVLILYFKSKGGYQAIHIESAAPATKPTAETAAAG
ncbi:MAG: MFS transporter [Verrucomicrobia bacterium]|nr:MAG: MFS transporter [Verrucomicrobiota bacterium]